MIIPKSNLGAINAFCRRHHTVSGTVISSHSKTLALSVLQLLMDVVSSYLKDSIIQGKKGRQLGHGTNKKTESHLPNSTQKWAGTTDRDTCSAS